MYLSRSRRLTMAAAAIVAIGTMTATTGPAVARSSSPSTSPSTGASTAHKAVNKSRALVQLNADAVLAAVTARTSDGRVNLRGKQAKDARSAILAERKAFRLWLRANAPKAKIVGSFSLSVNAVSVKLHGTSLATLRNAPQVKSVQYDTLYYPLDNSDPDLGLINAIDAWSTLSGGAADAGKGVKVAVVDTGIDTTHPCFSDAGFPSTPQLGDHGFTNNKVIVAKVFYNKAKSRGLTAQAIQDHGTHVAGTIACDLDTPATVNGATIPYAMSGVAPAAQLGNYNVFPGQVQDARSEDILNALDAAYQDGMDVANMSLGGNANGIQDLLTIAVDNLDMGGMVVAVAAGNSGPGHYTVESPGSAQRALTAGASSVGHNVSTPVTVGSTTFNAVSGDFETVMGADLTAPLGVIPGSSNGMSTACSSIGSDLTGEIAVLSRGACSFSTKIRNAQDAGAVAVLVVNNVAGDAISMAQDGTANQPTIPAYMLPLSDAGAIVAADGQSATIGATPVYTYNPATNNIMADFSSEGPTDVSWMIKPDVVAPGVNVLSSIPTSYCDGNPCFAFFSGTSMATPHLAGSAAVVISAFRAEHLDYTAADVRSAIVNTATQGSLFNWKDTSSVENDVNVVGAGFLNLDAAVGAQVAVGPVSTSFGKIPHGSGQTAMADVSLSSLTGSSFDVTLSIDDATSGVAFSVGATSVTVPASGSISVPLRCTCPSARHRATTRHSSTSTTEAR